MCADEIGAEVLEVADGGVGVGTLSHDVDGVDPVG